MLELRINKFLLENEKYKLNDNKKHTELILQGLQDNYVVYGDYYCPCKIQKIDYNVCPCKELVGTGICHCKLFKWK